jgi:hypothetical protein
MLSTERGGLPLCMRKPCPFNLSQVSDASHRLACSSSDLIAKVAMLGAPYQNLRGCKPFRTASALTDINTRRQ